MNADDAEGICSESAYQFCERAWLPDQLRIILSWPQYDELRWSCASRSPGARIALALKQTDAHAKLDP